MWRCTLVLLMACEPPEIVDLDPPEVDLGEVRLVGTGAGVLEAGILDGHLAHLVGTAPGGGNLLALGSVTLENTTTSRALIDITATVPGYTLQPERRDVEIGSFVSVTWTVAPTLDPTAFRELTEPTDVVVEFSVLADGEAIEPATAPLTLYPPGRMVWEFNDQDMRGFINTLVVPGAPEMELILQRATALVPDGGLNGYDGNAEGVLEEMAAIFDTLTENGQTFAPLADGFFDEPRQVLPLWRIQEGDATVVDGCLALAGAYEAIGLETFLFYLGNHMLVGARSQPGGDFYVLDPSVAGTGGFIEAAAEGVRRYDEAQGVDPAFLGLDLARAREAGVTPMQ